MQMENIPAQTNVNIAIDLGFSYWVIMSAIDVINWLNFMPQLIESIWKTE